MVVIFVLAVAHDDDPVGLYLKSCDFEAYEGRGHAEFTINRGSAKCFDSVTAAWNYWRTISKSCPIREDGKPNRPLTAFHIMVQEL